MLPTYSSSARSLYSTVRYSLSRHLYRLGRYLVACVVLFALLLLSPASQFVHARGGTWHEFIYHGQAGSRPYFVYTPEDYRPGTPVPLLVMLHGCTQTAADFAAGTQMDELADAHKFIVVYPQQTPLNNPTTCWNWSTPANQARGRGEPAILAGIVETIERNTSQWTIDRSRVFVAGASAGAVMSVILGATYPDLFAAIGVAAGDGISGRGDQHIRSGPSQGRGDGLSGDGELCPRSANCGLPGNRRSRRRSHQW